MMTISAELFDSTIRHQVFLERFKAEEINQLTAFLKKIDKELKARLSNFGMTEFNRARVEKLLGKVDEALKDIFDGYYDDLAGHLADLAEYESEFESRNLSNALQNSDFEPVIPAANQVRAAVFADPLSVRGADGGKIIEEFVDDWTSVERKRIVGAIRQGFFEGATTQEIIRNIRGTKAGGYRDGILAVTNRNSDAIVRTAVQHVASVARFETWKANTEVVTGYRWISTLDSRTTQVCRSLDQQVFELGQGPRPPVHIRCRSTTIAELDDRYSFMTKGRKRASIGGPVDGTITYYAWLKRQPVSFQNEAIGPTRAKLLRDGGLSAERFAKLNLDRNFKPMTLDEMRLKEPAAFELAFAA